MLRLCAATLLLVAILSQSTQAKVGPKEAPVIGGPTQCQNMKVFVAGPRRPNFDQGYSYFDARKVCDSIPGATIPPASKFHSSRVGTACFDKFLKPLIPELTNGFFSSKLDPALHVWSDKCSKEDSGETKCGVSLFFKKNSPKNLGMVSARHATYIPAVVCAEVGGECAEVKHGVALPLKKRRRNTVVRLRCKKGYYPSHKVVVCKTTFDDPESPLKWRPYEGDELEKVKCRPKREGSDSADEMSESDSEDMKSDASESGEMDGHKKGGSEESDEMNLDTLDDIFGDDSSSDKPKKSKGRTSRRRRPSRMRSYGRKRPRYGRRNRKRSHRRNRVRSGRRHRMRSPKRRPSRRDDFGLDDLLTDSMMSGDMSSFGRSRGRGPAPRMKIKAKYGDYRVKVKSPFPGFRSPSRMMKGMSRYGGYRSSPRKMRRRPQYASRRFRSMNPHVMCKKTHVKNARLVRRRKVRRENYRYAEGEVLEVICLDGTRPRRDGRLVCVVEFGKPEWIGSPSCIRNGDRKYMTQNPYSNRRYRTRSQRRRPSHRGNFALDNLLATRMMPHDMSSFGGSSPHLKLNANYGGLRVKVRDPLHAIGAIHPMMSNIPHSAPRPVHPMNEHVMCKKTHVKNARLVRRNKVGRENFQYADGEVLEVICADGTTPKHDGRLVCVVEFGKPEWIGSPSCVGNGGSKYTGRNRYSSPFWRKKK